MGVRGYHLARFENHPRLQQPITLHHLAACPVHETVMSFRQIEDRDVGSHIRLQATTTAFFTSALAEKRVRGRVQKRINLFLYIALLQKMTNRCQVVSEPTFPCRRSSNSKSIPFLLLDSKK